MIRSLNIMEWNANGLQSHINELLAELESGNIDICLISETHFTRESFIQVKNYDIYHTIHPSNNARGGSAILIKSNLEHFEEEKLSCEEFQATTITLLMKGVRTSFTSVYSPPRHNIKIEQYTRLINCHKYKFIMGGDFNAKNIQWGSRLTTTKGRELLKAINSTGCEFISTGTATYWPTDPMKKPDLIDFFITKKIPKSNLAIREGYGLSSDHSPIYLTYSCEGVEKDINTKLACKQTDWSLFKHLIDSNSEIPQINSCDDLDEEVLNFTTLLQQSAWKSMPVRTKPPSHYSFPPVIRNMVSQKRKLRKKWQQTRSPSDRNALNNATQALRRAIQQFNREHLYTYLSELSGNKSTEYSLWKATAHLKRPTVQKSSIKTPCGEWARSNDDKANAYAEYLATIFAAEAGEMSSMQEVQNSKIENIPFIDIDEVKEVISSLKMKKSGGYDLICPEILKNLPDKGLETLTILYNSVINLQYFPSYWKVAEIIMIPKPGKDPEVASSYRPISLLPLIGKVFEKLFSKRLNLVIERDKLIPNHQFGFRQKHSTIDQIHRVVHTIENAIEKKEICTAVFLDVSKAFDAVWHTGLIHKLNDKLPIAYCGLLKSYLTDRYFRVREDQSYSQLYPINSGVPQGSILGPMLYTLYTMDLPTNQNCITGTFADDTVILATGKTTEAASAKLQTALNDVFQWTKEWKITLNSSKSCHVFFTNREIDQPRIYIDDQQIPITKSAKYLGMTLDAKLRWKEHVKKKITELNFKYSKIKWLIGKGSNLSINNKLMVYNQVIKPIWAYGIQIWGCAKDHVIGKIQRFQNKILRVIVNAPWYIRNSDLHRDLEINTIRDEIQNQALKHKTRLEHHPNELIPALLRTEGLHRRLNRFKPHDLILRFNQQR